MQLPSVLIALAAVGATLVAAEEPTTTTTLTSTMRTTITVTGCNPTVSNCPALLAAATATTTATAPPVIVTSAPLLSSTTSAPLLLPPTTPAAVPSPAPEQASSSFVPFPPHANPTTVMTVPSPYVSSSTMPASVSTSAIGSLPTLPANSAGSRLQHGLVAAVAAVGAALFL